MIIEQTESRKNTMLQACEKQYLNEVKVNLEQLQNFEHVSMSPFFLQIRL